MPNSNEIVVKSTNLFVSSNDRSRSVSNNDDGTINIPFKNLPFHTEGPHQTLRISVMNFCAPNQFDRSVSPNNVFSLFIGSAVKTTTEIQNAGCSNPTAVQGGTLIGAQLLLPRYSSYSDIGLDFINAVAIALEPLYPSTESGATGFDYQITRLSGGGRTVPGNGSYLYNTIAPGVAPPLPNSWATVGNYTQNGAKVLTMTMTITNRSGSAFPDANWNQAVDDTAFGVFFDTSNDTYQQLGGKPTNLSAFPGFTAAAQKCAQGVVLDGVPGVDLPLNLVGLGGVYGGISVDGATLTITVSQRCPMVLTTEPLIYLRTNIASSNHSTSNMNEKASTPDPQDTEPSNILATFPINDDIIYFQEASGEYPVFSIDASAKSLNNLQLFLTDRHGNSDFRLFPNHSSTSFTSNLSFTCMLRLQVIERPVIEQALTIPTQQGLPPPRYHSHPLVQPDGGKDTMLDTAKNRLAARRM